MKFGRLFWGLILLFVGVILLGVNFGWWDSSVWLRVVDLWPLFFVVIGIGIIFGNNSPIGFILLLLMVTFSIAYVSNYKNLRNRIGKSDSISLFSQNISGDPDITFNVLR